MSRWARIEELVDLDRLYAANVVVAGVGSGGSTVALELAKAGVGHLSLIDPDVLEEVNLPRHECDDRYLGWNKAEAVEELIRWRNPDARVTALSEDVMALRALDRLVRDADLVAVCTDSNGSKHFLNRACTAAGIPAVYGGVYEKGAGGEIVRCMGGPDDACYACVMSVLKDRAPIAGVVGAGAPRPKAPVGRRPAEDLDYGAVASDGTARGAAGLGVDIRLIALLHAKICLQTLLGSLDVEGNVVLFGNAPIEGLFPRPFANAILGVARQEGCLVCSLI